MLPFDRIWDETYFEGTCSIYGVDKGGVCGFVTHVSINTNFGHDLEQLRLARLQKKARGVTPPKIAAEALHDEIVVAIGPKVSPTTVIKYLNDVIARIKRDGLFIGKLEDGNWCYEDSAGRIKDEKGKLVRPEKAR